MADVHQLLIDGEWVDARDGDRFDTVDAGHRLQEPEVGDRVRVVGGRERRDHREPEWPGGRRRDS